MRRHKNWQHQQMATHYRNVIADMLQEYDGAQKSHDWYMDIAWERLQYLNIYTWSSLSQSEKDRINNIISSYIAEQLSKYDSIIANSLSAIELLQERRTALISAAVTGKIDVRDWQAAA